jgi:Protein of unknown function (DUF3108)
MRSSQVLVMPDAAWRPRRRPAAWAALVLAVLLLHGVLLLALPPSRNYTPGVVAPVHPVVVRLLAPALPQAAPALAAALTQAPPVQAEATAQAVLDKPADRARPAVAQAAVAAAAATAALQDASVDEVAPPASTSADTAVPVYATRLPTSTRLRYQLQRGAVIGSGQLVWQRQGDAYELSLEGELQGMPVVGSISRGAIDADGVAPLRLADRRRSRELRAANFQREAQRITFSGPQVEYPLVAGAQDRLSWMIQLPAIVEADPSLARTGTRVTLFVVGTRGDAEAWHFEVQGRQALELPADEVADALHLLREAQRPYDTRVEVWLDPAQQHLPVRAVLTTVPGGQPLEFRLLGANPPSL